MGGKDRYFILTPSYICFFRNPTDANVTDDWFLTGKLSSSKDVGTLSHNGVKIPLDLIATVNVVHRQETKKVGGRDDVDSEESDEQDKLNQGDKESSAASRKTSEEKSAANGRKQEKAKDEDTEWETVDVETCMLEIDAGDVALTVDCHNKATRDVWLHSLEGWSRIRKNVVSEQTFDNFGAVAQYRMLDQAYKCHDEGSSKEKKRGSGARNSKTGSFFGSKSLTK
jgi:hypothetical protein